MKKLYTIVVFASIVLQLHAQSFVQTKQHQFFLDSKPYYYIGANYWYGSNLGLQKDRQKGFERLRRELDFLKSKGINNLRVLAAAEGDGLVNGVERVGPPLQTEKGKFNATVLNGIDILLNEMSERNMKAVLFFSNNWEWSGGFLQYLRWNGLIDDSVFRRKLAWDEMRDYVSKFYTCDACKKDYLKQVEFILNRINKVSGKKYIDEPAIMAWELANEPRPMRPSANEAYKKWISEVAAFIKSKDKNHLVTIGHEGYMGTESLELFEQVHANKNVDYLTIHIWPKNWSWFQPATMENDFSQVISKTEGYINGHVDIAEKLSKPLVIEEFGLPRDHHSFDITATTKLRDRYYQYIFDRWKQSVDSNGVVAGANFWAFNGIARPIKGQTFWKEGDDYMGDPPMEEQGLNGVFDSDKSTWDLVWSYTSNIQSYTFNEDAPSDKLATKETVNLFKNLKRLVNKGVMFGHQDALAYGVNWRYVEGKSDVQDVVGDYPAVYGWELGNIEHQLPYNLDSVPFDKMHNYIRQGFDRGGVITISWHADNPLNGESSWDTTHAVQTILPGGTRHELFKTWLDRVASFLGSLRSHNGTAIPILFRPWHEFTGNWFWWCRNTCTTDEFKLLFRYTVNYLRNEKGLHNLLIVYNTAGDFKTKQEFMERYPGDDIVDLVSFDSYQHGDPQKDNSFVTGLDTRLGILEEVAAERNKIPALAETGYEAIPYAGWWTNTLWKGIGDHKISFVLVWRNHGSQQNGKMHYYAPYKGQVSANNFIDFYKLDRTLFEKDVAKENVYK